MKREVIVNAILTVAQRIDTPEVEGKLLRIASTIMDDSDPTPETDDLLAQCGIEE